MGGLLARLGLSIAGGALAKALLFGGIATLIAGSYWAAVEYGVSLRGAKVDRQIIEREAVVQEQNYTVDQLTIQDDAGLEQYLRREKEKWMGTTSQKPSPPPQ